MAKREIFPAIVVVALAACSEPRPAAEAPELQPGAEIAAYMASPTRCLGEHADEAFRAGVVRFDEWRTAYRRGDKPPANAFRDAGTAFEFLYDTLQCRDGLVAFRLGNMLRLGDKPEKAIAILTPAAAAVRVHYPSHLPHFYSVLGQASVASGRGDEAIGYYEKVLELTPDDVATRLNLANQLLFKERLDEARRHVDEARRQGLSEYGRKQADKLERLLDDRADK